MSKFFVALDSRDGGFRAVTNPIDTIEEAWKQFWSLKKYYKNNVPLLVGTKIQVIEAEVLGEEEIG